MTVMAIDKAIESYEDRARGGSGAPPYDRESLATIYEPRVQQLLDLKREGFTHAEWTWDVEAGHNRWHGVTPTGGTP
jgi:hypothetical protein